MEKLVVLLALLPCISMKTLFSYPENDAPALRFAVIGDWGGIPLPPYHTRQEKMVAAELNRIVAKWGADFIVSVGDNFYYEGVKDVDDFRFQKTFENVFDGESLLDVPWYVVAGNHDHKGNVTAQMAYTNVSSRWKYTDLYYDLSFKIPKSNVSLRLLMLDTIVLCGNSDDFHGGQPLEAANPKLQEQQLEWLVKKLESSKDEYLLVAGHYPVWSIAEHGPTSCLVHHLEPLLKKYNVTAYLSGHDHNMQYLQDDHNIGYVVSGAGNFMEDSRKHQDSVPLEYLRYFHGDLESPGGFVYMKVTPKEMVITYIQSGGKSLFHTILSPRAL